MTLQIFMRGPRISHIRNDMVSATTINATGTTVYYYTAESEPQYLNKEVFTSAVNWATATAASATIEAIWPIPAPATITPLVSASASIPNP